MCVCTVLGYVRICHVLGHEKIFGVCVEMVVLCVEMCMCVRVHMSVYMYACECVVWLDTHPKATCNASHNDAPHAYTHTHIKSYTHAHMHIHVPTSNAHLRTYGVAVSA